MAEIRCPMCAKPNPEELEACNFCGALLKPLLSVSPDDFAPIHPGEQPVKKQTTELERVLPAFGEKGSIQPGDAPTKKNTAELERALPSWLRNLRGQDDGPPAAEAAKPFATDRVGAAHSTYSAQGRPPAPEAGSTPQPAEVKLPDWLAGFESGSEEEVPEWLADIRAEPQPPKRASAEKEPRTQPEGADWLKGLRHGEEEAQAWPDSKAPPQRMAAFVEPPFPSEPGEAAFLEVLPGWFSELKSESAPAQPDAGKKPVAAAGEPVSAPSEELPDWLLKLQEESKAPTQELPQIHVPFEESPDWLAKLQASAYSEPELPSAPIVAPGASVPAEKLAREATPFGESPDWLKELGASAYTEPEQPSAPEAAVPAEKLAREAAPFGESLDWLKELGASDYAEPIPPSAPEAAVPVEKLAREAAPFGESPDWLKELGASADTETEPPSAPIIAPEAAAPAEAIPAWLAELKAEAAPAAQAFTSPVEPLPVEKPVEALPDWLTAADFEKAAPLAEVFPPTGAQELASIPAEDSQANFPMEVPDWLSTLGLEEAEETVAGKSAQKAEAHEPGELPSWVQAMRPVEAVMAESEVPQEKAEEESAAGGPLAGLSGVLPLGPGLGPLRKMPAYSSKLQVTESQKRHAASLERLVSTESEPRPIKGQSRMPPARLLRWVIALVLILAASLPIVTGIQTVPGAIYPAELGPTRELINGLGTNSPVLVVFDYEPALSGELEAAAAPVIDHLLFKAPRLAIISTSPTGPILAERFLKTTQASHGYQRSDPVDQRGEGYINLGYLAGGPAGVLGFAQNPSVTAANSVEGAPAWGTQPLQGVQNLSDFAALIILTDNPDTGRIWIEQAGPYLKNSPLLMVISAQAEPMLRPYYDSGQIKGLVTGLAGGKAYEQANEPAFPGPGLARRYWDAFSLSLFLAEMMILIGGLWGAMAAWRARRNTVRAVSNGGTPVRDGKPEEGD